MDNWRSSFLPFLYILYRISSRSFPDLEPFTSSFVVFILMNAPKQENATAVLWSIHFICTYLLIFCLIETTFPMFPQNEHFYLSLLYLLFTFSFSSQTSSVSLPIIAGSWLVSLWIFENLHQILIYFANFVSTESF